jgi:primary-amine oxidase
LVLIIWLKVLDYLDHGGPAPARYAKVLQSDSEKGDPHYQYYIVGPLPVSNSTTLQPLAYPFSPSSGGKIRMLYGNMKWNAYQ